MSSKRLHMVRTSSLVRVSSPLHYDNLLTNKLIVEIKFSSLNDPPPGSESGTNVDEEYYIYQTPMPVNKRPLVFIPGIVQYLPCWSWLPSWGGWGSWIASWTATWVTPPHWMPSLLWRPSPSWRPRHTWSLYWHGYAIWSISWRLQSRHRTCVYISIYGYLRFIPMVDNVTNENRYPPLYYYRIYRNFLRNSWSCKGWMTQIK